MTALAILLLQTVSSTGFGAIVLRLLRVDRSLQWSERLSWSFVLGIGVLGWLLFFAGTAGLFSPSVMLALLFVGVPGIFFLSRPGGQNSDPLTTLEKILLAVLLLALFLDCLEGLSPPADGDSLTYHFAAPKRFLQEGRLFFIPRAADGAVPLLLQMTYTSALGLGGEKALTLWTMVSGWGAAFLLYDVARNHMSRAWALSITVIWLTTPAVLYGGGSGQVEVRNAGFVLLAGAALMRSRETQWLRYAAVAGLAVGFFIASKYTGLFFAAAVTVALLTLRGWPRQVIVFGVTAVLAGFQWYLWNYLHTGDPVFPVLYSVIGDANYHYWDADHQQAFQHNLFLGERAIPNTPIWMLAYPFFATFATSGIFDSERAGMGPLLLFLLPFSVAGFWRYRHEVVKGPWLAPLIFLTLFYALWFLSGSSQRVRHMLPLYPIALLACMYLAVRWGESARVLWPLYLSVVLTFAIQMAGHGASSINYAHHLFTGETRDAFYERNISGFASVKWINDNLSDRSKLMFVNREMNYLIDIPSYFAHPATEIFVDIRPDANNPERYYRQLKALGITHILSTPTLMDRPATEMGLRGMGQWRALLAAGCVTEVTRIPYQTIRSRSLNIRGKSDEQQLIMKLGGLTCAVQ